MKLYTQEQIKLIGDWASQWDLYELDKENNSKPPIFKSFIEELTPIELPSDEDIYSILRGKKMFEKDWGFIEGAKWMREQIIVKEDKTFKQKSKWTEVDNMTRRLK